VKSSWEVELKFEVAEESVLLHKLAVMGFEPRGIEQHCDFYFRHPCRDFRVTDEAFRLRQIDSRAYVTYKGPRQAAKVKTRPEIELGLVADELEAWKEMLERLGFVGLPVVRKRRQIFRPALTDATHAGFTVTLDEVEQLGRFAEIELIVEQQQRLEQARTRVERLSAKLGLEHEQPRSYLSQLLEKIGFE
jgi:adenylate cyclase class 2